MGDFWGLWVISWGDFWGFWIIFGMIFVVISWGDFWGLWIIFGGDFWGLRVIFGVIFAPPDEEIEITFSYWDGSGHRRTVKVGLGGDLGGAQKGFGGPQDTFGGARGDFGVPFPPQMKKGNTMQQFLQKALEILRKDFSELR